MNDRLEGNAALGVPFLFKQWGEWAPGYGRDAMIVAGELTSLAVLPPSAPLAVGG